MPLRARRELSLQPGDGTGGRDALTRAEGACAARMAARLHQEATREGGDWRAAEAWLKRRRREEWGENVSVSADRRAAELLAELLP